ncbi:DUF6415 family natural product biosynthesis protein [Streptomyces halobius]|uniref:DUF6415 family natural product biosynthesis protein n=1 Tax=Streptomyces halobius TaxID=2879846 RepID=A0ABY4M1R6_9ACTN|nr:DUF6415 family natural product biosynthesis protein [Streptomyces halobius]UQA91417.1 DUF6415 family natural product biosynthesis protein [Streptomyces halobius]
MTTDRIETSTVMSADLSAPDPIDEETIQSTIDRAQELRDASPCADELSELEEELRGHIARLLPEARKPTRHLGLGSIEEHRLTARLDAIERLTRQGPGQGALAAHVQVHQLARGCQYLLARHTAETR